MWTSLEVAKLAVAGLTPLLLLGLGFWFNRRLKELEHSQWANQKVIERRLVVYDKMAPALNEIYCFFQFVGDFRSFEPKDIVAKKRTLDRTFFVNKPLFSEAFHRSYFAFIEVCFLESGHAGEDAKLRTTPEAQEFERGSWDSDWTKLLAPEKASSTTAVKEAYERLMATFASELGVLRTAGDRA